MSAQTLPLADHKPISIRVQLALIPDLLSFRSSALPASKTSSVRGDLDNGDPWNLKKDKHVNACDKKIESASKTHTRIEGTPASFRPRIIKT